MVRATTDYPRFLIALCGMRIVTIDVPRRFGMQKPPFKFLFDIVVEVMRATGFADGLYTAEELDRDASKDKEAKVSFLKKIIQV